MDSKNIYKSDSASLWLGDATKLDMLGDNSVDLICTSPPFNLKSGKGPSWQVTNWYPDDMPENEYQEWQVACLEEMRRVAKDGASLFYNHKSRQREHRAIHPLTWIQKSSWKLVQPIVWDRGSTLNHQSSGMFWPQDEYIFWMIKGDGNPFFNKECARWSTVWKMNFDVNSWHPAPFPLELATRCILACSKEGDTVLDPFSGSGTTCVAAQNLHRIGIGVDKSLEYLDKSKLRLAQKGM